MSQPVGIKRLTRRVLEHEGAKRLLRPVFHAWQDAFDPKVLQANAALRGRHTGERVFVLGTGISLRDVDVTLLRGRRVMGTGHLHSPDLDINIQRGRTRLVHQDRWPRDLQLDYYAAVDPVWEHASSVEEQQFFVDYWRSANAAFPDPQTVFFANGTDVPFYRRHGLLAGRQLHFVKSAGPTDGVAHPRWDLTRRMHFVDGSVFFMLAASLFLGFREIVILGCDYTFKPNRAGHYYDDVDVVRDQPLDGRHLLFRRLADARGVRVLNVVSEGFASPIYEPISWPTVAAHLERGEW